MKLTILAVLLIGAYVVAGEREKRQAEYQFPGPRGNEYGSQDDRQYRVPRRQFQGQPVQQYPAAQPAPAQYDSYSAPAPAPAPRRPAASPSQGQQPAYNDPSQGGYSAPQPAPRPRPQPAYQAAPQQLPAYPIASQQPQSPPRAPAPRPVARPPAPQYEAAPAPQYRPLPPATPSRGVYEQQQAAPAYKAPAPKAPSFPEFPAFPSGGSGGASPSYRGSPSGGAPQRSTYNAPYRPAAAQQQYAGYENYGGQDGGVKYDDEY